MIWLFGWIVMWVSTCIGLGYWIGRDQDGIVSAKDIMLIIVVGFFWPVVLIGGACYWVSEESQNFTIDVSRWVGLGKEEDETDEQ